VNVIKSREQLLLIGICDMKLIEHPLNGHQYPVFPILMTPGLNTLEDMILASRAVTVGGKSMIAAADRKCFQEVRN
jgi:hypothetical protein